jgi:cobalt-zinc-cadmium resistance protein CzcA
MVRRLIEWAVTSPLIVILVALGLAGFGTYAFFNVNVEAYPDPAPAIIEVVAQWPGASAEEVERRVTIPLEITLTGMKGLKYTRSKSLFGLSHLRNQFEYGIDFYAARQEVINRLQFTEPLPPSVSPQISPMTPTGELMRYALSNPLNLYPLDDLKALQDWTVVRQFKRVPGVIDVTSFGGTVKRYEVQPAPDRLKYYGITLQQLQTAISNGNSNVGGDYLVAGDTVLNVRGVGLLGSGQDPMQAREVLGLEADELRMYLATASDLSQQEKARLTAAFSGAKLEPPLTTAEARRLREIRGEIGMRAARIATPYLRGEDESRLRGIRQIVITAVNNVPVLVDNIAVGGTLSASGAEPGQQGVVVGHQTRLGKVSLMRPQRTKDGRIVTDADGHVVWQDEEEKVIGIVLMRKGEETLPTLKGVKAKLEELNDRPGRMLPGVQLQPYFDQSRLIEVTTETVRENLLLGMVLVTVVLLMFLNNISSALIVAINIPLALLFAFSVLFLRGKSANLLSIGAVDFGIIVDSSVIMVENIYRHLSSGEFSELPLRDRIVRASHEVQRGLFFSTLIMICAFIPLFTMQGPEGQIFGPMADTYAFALAGALLLALTLSPALCLLFFRGLKPTRDNFLVRWLRSSYLRQLAICLNHRWVTLGVFCALLAGTLAMVPSLGREFMPELEEGNLYIRGTFPVNISMEEAADKTRRARTILGRYPEVELVQSQVGRPDDGTDPTGFYNAEFTVPLKPPASWPLVKERQGWQRWLGATRRRVKTELVQDMSAALDGELPGVDWNFSQYLRDNVMESLSGVKGDNSVKIIGPDLAELERLANLVKARIEEKPEDYQGADRGVRGIKDVGVFSIMGQAILDLHVDRRKCKLWGVSPTDVNTVIQSAVGGQALSQMVEGEKTFDITLRWPASLRGSEQAILDIPVDIGNNTVTNGVPSVTASPFSGGSTGLSPFGYSGMLPARYGSAYAGTLNNITSVPRLRLRDLVTPVNAEGLPDPKGHFTRPGASTIYREQGNRLIAVKFSVRGRDLAGAVAEAQRATADLFQAPYRPEWSGEFAEMEMAERRLLVIIPLSLGLIFMLLYLAFRSLLDALAILSNVLALSMGGCWALWLTGTNFSISAAVGFISIFGVAVMDGLLSVSYFNALRSRGKSLREAIMEGAAKRVRPMMMTALTAIFGLLPAAVSTRIGAQTQQPLAIVVVGGMIMTLLLNRYLMPVLYSFYGHREPPVDTASLAH